MVKQPTAEQTEFQMSNEDFPALPGTQLNDLMSSSSSQQLNLNHSIGGGSNVVNSGDGMDCPNGSTRDLDGKTLHHMSGDMQNDSSAQDKAFKRGIQTSPDGMLIPFNRIFFLTNRIFHPMNLYILFFPALSLSLSHKIQQEWSQTSQLVW